MCPFFVIFAYIYYANLLIIFSGLKNKQNGEADNKSKNQKNGDSNKSDTKNQKNGDADKSDKKNQCKEIVLKVYMHCEGCASQVSHCLRGYDGKFTIYLKLSIMFIKFQCCYISKKKTFNFSTFDL